MGITYDNATRCGPVGCHTRCRFTPARSAGGSECCSLYSGCPRRDGLFRRKQSWLAYRPARRSHQMAGTWCSWPGVSMVHRCCGYALLRRSSRNRWLERKAVFTRSGLQIAASSAFSQMESSRELSSPEAHRNRYAMRPLGEGGTWNQDDVIVFAPSSGSATFESRRVRRRSCCCDDT